MPTHVDETSKQSKEVYPKGTPKAGARATEAATTGAEGPTRLTKDQQVELAKQAWDRMPDKTVTWDELDGEAQRRYFDVSVGICRFGSPGNTYELSVAEVWGELLAGTYVPPAPPPPPEGDAPAVAQSGKSKPNK